MYPFWRQYKSIKHLQRPGLKICRGLVKDVDPAAQLVTYEDAEDAGKTYQVRYDRFVLASGMIRSWPSAPRQTLKKAYVQDATNMVNNITRVPGGHIVVIGGGEKSRSLKIIFGHLVLTIHRSCRYRDSSRDYP